jgi:paraquat-inducible protein A
MTSVIVCHACDLAHRRDTVLPAVRVRCVRCGAELYRTNAASVDSALALAASAGILLVLSNLYPLVTFDLNGSSRDTTLLGATVGLYQQGYVPVAALVLLTSFLAPLFEISAVLYLLLPIRRRERALAQNPAFRLLMRLRPWVMSEVFMLGALVAMVKLAALSHVIPGISLYSYGALMLALSALTFIAPSEQFWHWAQGFRE